MPIRDSDRNGISQRAGNGVYLLAPATVPGLIEEATSSSNSPKRLPTSDEPQGGRLSSSEN